MTTFTLDGLENLQVERDGAIAIVTVSRPKVLNALNLQTLDELRRTILALKHDAGVRVVILTGAGEKSFVAGADINELAVQTPSSGRDHAMSGQHVLDLIENMGKPVIAAINGYALGGGCELAMACTIRIASETAKLGQPEINLGIIPGYAGTQRLARLVGKGRALELLLTGEPIDAATALDWGLVNQVVPAAELDSTVTALVGKIAEASSYTIALGKKAFYAQIERDERGAYEHTREVMTENALAADAQEGMGAFLEKRPPTWSGS
jgi:enoyl-CoA hydratase